MKNLFQKAATDPLSVAERALKSWGIEYAKQPDGFILIPGNLDISNECLTKLPDLSAVIVGGDFACSCNQLTSLEYAPHSIGGGFYCHNNQLTSLEHAPHSIGGGFYCHNNQLTSLEHAPQTVSGDFYCFNNQLTSLEHAPHTVGGALYCHINQLTSLEQAPQQFKTLYSDFGEFASWNAVPEHLRLSPETKSRLKQEQLACAIRDATVTQAPIKVSSPLRLKLRTP